MKLSTRGQYALHAMLFLADKAQDGPQALKTIADIGLPEQYLEQLLGKLRRAGLVKAQRGHKGGYYIARAAKDVSLADIIFAVEGPMRLATCLGKGGSCDQQSACIARDAWLYLTQNIENLMSAVTLKDLLDKKPLPTKEYCFIK